MVTSLLTYFSGLIHQSISLPGGLTSMELSLVLLGLLIISVALMFRGNDAGQIVFSVAGLYLGGFFAYNTYGYLNIGSVPIYLAIALGAILGVCVMTFATRVGLAIGFGMLVYLLTAEYYPVQFYSAALTGAIAFVVALMLYSRFVHVIATTVGAFSFYFAMLRLGVFATRTVVIATAVLFVAGVAFQELDRRRRDRKLEQSRTHYHQSETHTHVTAGK